MTFTPTSTSSTETMVLLTLSNDILVELLTFSPDLNTLHALILTHTALYDAFSNRRRQILRHVFRNQSYPGSSSQATLKELEAANAYVSSLDSKKHLKPIDRVALRESLWPEIKAMVPSRMAYKWGVSLQMGYRKAGLDEDAVAFGRAAAHVPVGDGKWTIPAALKFFGLAIETMVNANLHQEATELHTKVFAYLQTRNPHHDIWARGLVKKYAILLKDVSRARKFQLEIFEEYISVLGSEHPTTLSWARLLISDYQANEEHEKALQFHKQIRELLIPSKATYIAWSRQTIKMARKLGKEAEALSVITDVRGRLGPGASGYYAWTNDLIHAYEKAGRNEDAISVCENAYEAIQFWKTRNPNDTIWSYKLKLSGLLLVKVYRRHGRMQDAARIEETCKGIENVFG